MPEQTNSMNSDLYRRFKDDEKRKCQYCGLAIAIVGVKQIFGTTASGHRDFQLVYKHKTSGERFCDNKSRAYGAYPSEDQHKVDVTRYIQPLIEEEKTARTAQFLLRNATYGIHGERVKG